MKMRHWWHTGLALLLAAGSATAETTKANEPITVAVAANMQPAFEGLAQHFQQQIGVLVQGSFASTGKLSAQIRQGAPFHILLAADTDYPLQLQQDGFALQPPRQYAIGALVIWTTRNHALENWPQLLASPAIVHIAIADPKTAPYGREAARALQHYRLLRALQDKLIFGESIGQTNQFIATGAADIGFTAKASVINSKIGHWRELDTASYQPIRQSAVLLKHAQTQQRQAAERFYQFLFSRDAQQVLQEHGYLIPTTPGPTPAAQNHHE